MRSSDLRSVKLSPNFVLREYQHYWVLLLRRRDGAPVYLYPGVPVPVYLYLGVMKMTRNDALWAAWYAAWWRGSPFTSLVGRG
jgi:hypothetical protein